MLTNETVRVGYTHSLIEYLRIHHPAESKQIESLFNMNVFEMDIDERIPVATWGKLLDRAVELTQDDGLPLKIAETILPRHWGVFAYVAISCKTLADVIEILIKYERLIDDANDTQFIIDGNVGTLKWLPRVTQPSLPCMAISLASWVIFARKYTGRSDLKCDAQFTTPPPGNHEKYQTLFGGNITFNQPFTAIIFDTSYLNSEITHYDDTVHDQFKAEARLQLSNLTKHTDHIARIRQAITHGLPKGRVTVSTIANTLALAPRTLQHELAKANTSFQALLDDIRKERALFYLRHSNKSLVEISHLLGLSDQSSFTKAFKNWTGTTPGEFRKQTSTQTGFR